jgi:hypothetical protein
VGSVVLEGDHLLVGSVMLVNSFSELYARCSEPPEIRAVGHVAVGIVAVADRLIGRKRFRSVTLTRVGVRLAEVRCSA